MSGPTLQRRNGSVWPLAPNRPLRGAWAPQWDRDRVGPTRAHWRGPRPPRPPLAVGRCAPFSSEGLLMVRPPVGAEHSLPIGSWLVGAWPLGRNVGARDGPKRQQTGGPMAPGALSATFRFPGGVGRGCGRCEPKGAWDGLGLRCGRNFVAEKDRLRPQWDRSRPGSRGTRSGRGVERRSELPKNTNGLRAILAQFGRWSPRRRTVGGCTFGPTDSPKGAADRLWTALAALKPQLPGRWARWTTWAGSGPPLEPKLCPFRAPRWPFRAWGGEAIATETGSIPTDWPGSGR